MMRILPGTALLAVAAAFAMNAGSQEAKQSAASFEIRLAEKEPAEGLKPASVEGTKTKIYLHKEIALTSKDVAAAQPAKDANNKPTIEITMTDQGAAKLAKLSAAHLGKPLAMMVDGKVLFAPIVRSKIADGKVMVTGNFSKEEAVRIAKVIHGK